MNKEEINQEENSEGSSSSGEGSQSPIDNEKKSIFYILGLFSSIENDEDINNEVYLNKNPELKEQFIKGYNRKDFDEQKQKVSLEKDKIINKNKIKK